MPAVRLRFIAPEKLLNQVSQIADLRDYTEFSRDVNRMIKSLNLEKREEEESELYSFAQVCVASVPSGSLILIFTHPT